MNRRQFFCMSTAMAVDLVLPLPAMAADPLLDLLNAKMNAIVTSFLDQWRPILNDEWYRNGTDPTGDRGLARLL